MATKRQPAHIKQSNQVSPQRPSPTYSPIPYNSPSYDANHYPGDKINELNYVNQSTTKNDALNQTPYVSTNPNKKKATTKKPNSKSNHPSKSKSSDFRLLNSSSPFYFQEAYNSLRTNLKSMFINNMYQKIIITSSIPNEGKSNITLNLGISLATDGSKVLIIDCDLRKPSINQYLKIPKGVSAGLVNILQKPSNVFENVVYFEDLGIDVLTAGSPPPNPSELLGSENMRTVIEQVEPYYDYILFDTPPVGVVTDAAVLSQFTDGALLVVKQNFVTFNQAQQSKTRLQSVGCAIIGCILNDYNIKTTEDDTYTYYYSENNSK